LTVFELADEEMHSALLDDEFDETCLADEFGWTIDTEDEL